MKRTAQLIIIFTITILMFGCHKDDQKIPDGIYTGTFKVKYNSGENTGATTLVLQNGKYTCTGNANRIPAGGSGTFTADNGKITFNDENVWTADFDWNLILSGQYNYTFDGKKLKISAAKNEVGNFEYNLEKN